MRKQTNAELIANLEVALYDCENNLKDLPHIAGAINQVLNNLKKQNKDQPLQVELINDRIEISIGIETLKYCHNRLAVEFDEGFGPGYLIEDAKGFAEDVISELKKEEENGDTITTDLLDLAMEKAVENGSMYVEEIKYKDGKPINKI